MAAGYQFQGRCYESLSDANDAFFGASGPSVTAGSTTYLTRYDKVSGVWKAVTEKYSASGSPVAVATVTLSSVQFASCDSSTSILDGVAVGWAVAAVLVLVWGARRVRGQLR